jgi:hypothetical protein
MKRRIALLLTILLLLPLTTAIASAFDPHSTDLDTVQIMRSSNGDGFTPHDLQWIDGAKGHISFYIQQEGSTGDYAYRLVLYHNGHFAGEFNAHGARDGLVQNCDISDTMKSPGEYVFVVFAHRIGGSVYDDIVGVPVKSEPYVLGNDDIVNSVDDNPTDNISLTVEVRSETQAIITLTDARQQELIQRMKDEPEFSVIWVISFGENIKYHLNMTSVLNRPGEINGDFYSSPDPFGERKYIYFLTSSFISIRPHAPSRIDFREWYADSYAFTATEDCLIWEVSMPPGENIDFMKVTQYDFSYIEMTNGISFADDNFEKTFLAADVVDMRNFGQVYDIGVPDTEITSSPTFDESVFGLTYEQAEMLYFTPPENRYVIWRGRLEGNLNPADLWDDGKNEQLYLNLEVNEIVCFDENGMVTNVMTKVYLDEDTGSLAFSFIITARGYLQSKHKVVIFSDRDNVLYTRSSVFTPSGVRLHPDFEFLKFLDRENIRHIDAYIEAMKNRTLHYELTEIIKRQD